MTKDTAICMRAVDFSETSQIVTFFTRATGKIGVIAKGSKRPKSSFDGPIEMFSYGKIVFLDSAREKLATLTEFEQQPNFTHLTNNLFALNCASFAAELVDKLTNEYDPHPQLFDSLLQFLQDVQQTRDTLRLLILFQLTLLKEVGLQPILNACVNCKSDFAVDWGKTYFSSSANGLVCRNCENSFPDRIGLSNTAVACLAELKMIAESQEKTLNEIEKILVYHFTELLHRPPKMAKYILNRES